MTTINKYNNGKIYKIVSDSTDKIYVGSTTQPLSKRHYEHKKNFQFKIKWPNYSENVYIINCLDSLAQHGIK